MPQGGWTAYAPSQPAPERHQRMDEELARHREAQDQARAILTDHAELFEGKARRLLDQGQVSIRASSGRVDAKLLRFRDHAVPETRGTTANGNESSHGMQRIEAEQLGHAVPLLSGCLQQAVLHLGNEPGWLR